MPDPLLEIADFNTEYADAARIARFYDARVWQESQFVFIELPCLGGRRLLARLECQGFPEIAPDLVFLDPQTRAVSAQQKDWPPHSPVHEGNGALHLCVSGTRWFEMTHNQRGPRKDRSLTRLLEVLALCCSGHAQALSGVGGR
jgi:hypothetical protein